MSNKTAAPVARDPESLARPPVLQILLEMAVVFSPIILTDLPWLGLEDGTLLQGTVDSLGIVASMILATFALKRIGSGWTDMGMGRPKSWLVTFGLSLLVIIASFVALAVVQVVLAMVLPAGEEADLSRFENLRGNLPYLMLAIVGVWITAGFGEEMLVRGFMMNRLAQLFGNSIGAWIAAAVISSVLFGLMHAYQGTAGMIITGVAGFVLALAYLVCKRNLWVTIIAHGLVNTNNFILFYLGAVPTGGG